MAKTKIEWSVFPSWPNYEISIDGRVRNRKTKHILRLIPNKDGYLTFYPRRARKIFAHRAVLETFVGPPPTGHETRHLDGDPKNNHLSNLSWGTRLQNVYDKQRHGTQPRGEKVGTAKLTEEEVLIIRKLHGRLPLRKLGEIFGVSHTAIRRAAIGIKWEYLTD